MKKQDKGLSVWQIVMLALGTVIGGSFFLGCSVAIHTAGPSVVIGFIFGGILVYRRIPHRCPVSLSGGTPIFRTTKIDLR